MKAAVSPFKRWLQKNGLLQIEVAKKLGVSATQISYWASGKNKPNHRSLRRIAKAYRVTVEELIGADVGADDTEGGRWVSAEKIASMFDPPLEAAALDVLMNRRQIPFVRIGDRVAFDKAAVVRVIEEVFTTHRR